MTPTEAFDKWYEETGCYEADPLMVRHAMHLAFLAGRASGLDEAHAIASKYDVPDEPRTEGESVAHRIAEGISRLKEPAQ